MRKKILLSYGTFQKMATPLKRFLSVLSGYNVQDIPKKYDTIRKEVVLHLTTTFDNPTITDDGQQQKITDLLT